MHYGHCTIFDILKFKVILCFEAKKSSCSIFSRIRLISVPIKIQCVQYICSAQSRNRYNSRIVLRKVGILTLLRKVGILTLRKTILELVLRKVGIGTKWE